MKSKFAIHPVISEKSYLFANALGKYTFEIDGKANKIEIKKEVESKYKVKVTDVKVITVPGKLKRNWTTYRRFRKEDSKKAIVTLKKGDQIKDFIAV